MLMNADDLDKLEFDLRKFFDFENHKHIYHFHIWKGQFSLRETRSAATYADIAGRFELAIDWIKEVRRQDRPTICPECGAEDDRVARILSFAVITRDNHVFREHHDDLGWDDMIRLLRMAVIRLREMSEPARPCAECGRASTA